MTVHSPAEHRAHQSPSRQWTALGLAALAIVIVTIVGGFAIYTWGWREPSAVVTGAAPAEPAHTRPTVTTAGGMSASRIPLKHPGTLAVSGVWLDGLLVPPVRSGGKVTGFDADLVNRIAARYSVPRVQWIDAHAPVHVQERADLVVNNLVDASSSRYRYSAPFLADNLGLLVRTGSPAAGAQTLSAVAKLKIGVLSRFSEAYVVATVRPQASPEVFSSLDAASSALKNGEVDALLTFLPVGYSLAGNGLKFTAQVPTGLQYAFQVAADSPILPALNRALAEMRASGTLDGLVKKWFPKTYDLPVLKG